MSKLYEILQKLESGRSPLAEKIHQKKGTERSRWWMIPFLIFLFLAGSGAGFYFFTRFLAPGPSAPYRKALSRPLPQKALSKRDVPPPKPQESSPSPKKKQGPPLPKEKPRAGIIPQKVVVLSSPKSPPKTLERKKKEKAPLGELKKEPASPPPLSPEERLRGLLIRAEALRAEGRCREALELYRQYLAERRAPEVINNYAACLWLVGRVEEAELWFRKSLSLKEDPEVRLNLVLLALTRGKEERACRELGPLDPERLSGRALEIYQRLKSRLRCTR